MRTSQKSRYLQPWLFGVIAGALVVLAEVVLKLAPPSAYVVCLSCHTRDLLNTIINAVWAGNYPTAVLAKRMVMLTSPGVLLGAFAAAKMFDERRIHRSTHPVWFFLIGFGVMLIGLVIFGCPTRIVIRVGYGEFYGIAALVGMIAGILCGTVVMRLRWRK
ncbi:MAG: hypothetical protein GY801_00930 [bacterium]|nr:hypothetical protein [bacterium]